MNKKQFLESILLAVFLLAATGVLFKFPPHAAMTAAISAFSLAMIYFYAHAWLQSLAYQS